LERDEIAQFLQRLRRNWGKN